MKTELKACPHSQIEGAIVFELWHNGVFIGEVTGAEGPGIRVISKYPMLPQWHADAEVKLVEIRIASEPPSSQPLKPFPGPTYQVGDKSF